MADGRLARRRFLKLIPAAVAVPALAQQPRTPEPPAKIDKTALDVAEKVVGLDFTEAEEEMALRGANRNLESYETLRKLDIPLDTEPAITFHAWLPGKRPKPGAAPGAPLKLTRPALPSFGTTEDLAFLPVTTIGALI